MTVESILSAIETKRPDLTRQEARAVATDVFYSGEAVEDILASSTLDKLINGYKSRQSAAAKSVTANDPTVCPVCKVPLKPIKLANDRKAVFCSKHFVVFPVPPSKEGE
jgi:hypothetical protein